MEELWQRKGHCLAEPDVLICGVGTRIYHRSNAGAGAAAARQLRAAPAAGCRCSGAQGTGRPGPDGARAGCCGPDTTARWPLRAGWQEDARWTAAMAQGWDSARVRAIVDGLLAAAGPGG